MLVHFPAATGSGIETLAVGSVARKIPPPVPLRKAKAKEDSVYSVISKTKIIHKKFDVQIVKGEHSWWLGCILCFLKCIILKIAKFFVHC